MKILSSFTHPHIVPNLYEFLFILNIKEDILKNTVNQTVAINPALEVNGNQQQFGSSKYLLLCSTLKGNLERH